MNQSLAIGIDLGGTNTAFGIINADGEILAKGSMPTTGHNSLEEYMLALKGILGPMIDGFGRDRFVGVGIGAPSGNYFTSEIDFAPNLPWKGVIPFGRLVGEALELKAILTNDAKAAAIGEMKYGAAKGINSFIMVTLGTGLGSGFMYNGQIIYGHDALAGELGHVIAVRDGRKCNCGLNGCLERYASATGIVITAEMWLDERPDQPATLREHRGSITAKMITEAAQTGDVFALELFEYTGKILGQTLASAVAITSPKAIIFFGGLAHAGNLIIDPVRRHMEENLLYVYQNKISLLQSALPDADAAILGASALVW